MRCSKVNSKGAGEEEAKGEEEVDEATKERGSRIERIV